MKKRHNFNRFRTAISRSAVASVLALTSGSVIAAPAVFFNDDIEAGKQTFIDTVTAADAAYNAANPGATQQSTVFAFDITNSTGSTFSVTQNGQTVYVVSKLAGNNAPNNRNGDEGNDGFTTWSVNYASEAVWKIA